jgi:hypothetical protein
MKFTSGHHKICANTAQDVDFRMMGSVGEFRDQGDANWIVIRRPLWGHNDTLCGRPAPGRPMAARGLAARRA